MPDYTFTVRATDNAGAFADRSFTITVANNAVERFVALGSAGVAHSPTGLNGSWTVEPGVTGDWIEFGGGKWVVWNDAGTVMRTSLDGANWSTTNPVWPVATPDGVAATQLPGPNAHVRMKYKNGKWIAFRSCSSSSGIYLAEYESADLTSWTYTGRYLKQAGTPASDMWCADIDYDPVTDRWVILVPTQLGKAFCTRQGAANWAPSTYVGTGGTTIVNGAVVCLNGLWVVNPGFTAAMGMYVSTDGVNWTQRVVNAGNTAARLNGMTYSNGRLVFVCHQAGLVTYTFASLNGGRTWTPNDSPGTGPVPGDSKLIYLQPVASYGGVSVLCTNTAGLTVSQDGYFAVSTQVTIPAGAGSLFGVAVRNS